MGSLRSLRNGREQMESTADSFGYRFDGKNPPDNAWYYVDHTGQEHCVNDAVKSVLTWLEAQYDDVFNVIELHDHLIKHEPDKFSEIQVTVSKPGDEKAKLDRYFTFRPDSDEPSRSPGFIKEEMNYAADKLWDEIGVEDEEIGNWEADNWLSGRVIYRPYEGEATIRGYECRPDYIMTHNSMDAELKQIAEDLDAEAEWDGVVMDGTYKYLCGLRDALKRAVHYSWPKDGFFEAKDFE